MPVFGGFASQQVRHPRDTEVPKRERPKMLAPWEQGLVSLRMHEGIPRLRLGMITGTGARRRNRTGGHFFASAGAAGAGAAPAPPAGGGVPPAGAAAAGGGAAFGSSPGRFKNWIVSFMS